ncbi:SAM-dependent methyltransferase [Natronosporangium hydrolyticum]|uniref:TRM11 family SAM-dependent methyltransferase n=1 Tax=Natronosporangium hydrolyticum TaxID=2811111 RepID=UPI00308424FE
MRYLLLIAPSSNRVYAGEALRLAERELAAFGETVLRDAGLRDVSREEVAGVEYLGFTAEPPLTDDQLGFVSNLSGAYVLFGWEGPESLRPVRLTPTAYYDDDLLTILKYPGKTNEQFTRLLLNLTVAASQRSAELRGGERPEPSSRLVVCDPLCGRGTTLNQALRYGYDAVGIEADNAHVDAYAAFLRTWLRRKRLKHRVEIHPVRHERQRVARRLTASVAPSKAAHDAGADQRVTVVHADTLRAREFLKGRSCDVIVTDAPYGVVHGSRAAGRSARDRRPQELLDAALPGWVALLRPGGALGLSFNTHLASREEIAELLTRHDLSVVDSPGYQGFDHWVDQGITRDLLVATMPSAPRPAGHE